MKQAWSLLQQLSAVVPCSCEYCNDLGFVLIEDRKFYCDCPKGKSVEEFDGSFA